MKTSMMRLIYRAHKSMMKKSNNLELKVRNKFKEQPPNYLSFP